MSGTGSGCVSSRVVMAVHDAMLSRALDYAAAGIPVIPLSGKVPRTAHGKDDATADADVITSWWRRWPAANIGVRPPSGLVVLDVDPRHGGDRELVRLQREHEPLPSTLTAETGSGGLHAWLAYYGPACGKLAPGIDVKRETGYLVAPPSVHPETGRAYRWINECTTAPAPQWLRKLLNPPPPPTRRTTATGSLEPLVRVIEQDPGGELNNRLFWSCCRAVEQGLDTGPLVEAAVAQGHPVRGAERTAASAAGKGVAA